MQTGYFTDQNLNIYGSGLALQNQTKFGKLIVVNESDLQILVF